MGSPGRGIEAPAGLARRVAWVPGTDEKACTLTGGYPSVSMRGMSAVRGFALGWVLGYEGLRVCESG